MLQLQPSVRTLTLLLAACTLFAPPAVIAATPSAPTVTCSGTMQADLGLAFGDCTNGVNCQTVAQNSVNSVFDQAECLCDSTDLYVYIKVTTAFPEPPADTFQVWVGSACDQAVNRQTTTTVCEQITDTPLTTSTFSAGASGPVYQRIPIRALLSPVSHSCGGAPSNAVWFLFLKDSSTVDAYCSITYTSSLTPPSPPESVSAGSGDGAISVTWTSPPLGSIRPAKYQVLCADSAGNPISRGTHTQGYSTCTTSGIKRRPPSTSGNVTTSDGGTTTTDAGTSESSLDPSGVDPAGMEPSEDGVDVDAGSGEGEAVDAGSGSSGTTGGPAPFTDLDPSFICSDILDGTATSARLSGLTNGETYQFVVVGIDDYGNPAPSAVVTGTPFPTEDLYRRFLAQGGKSQGFCFIATAAYGSYDEPQVRTLRRFRDEVLLTSSWGAALVDRYYELSPPVADYLRRHAPARWATRVALWPVIGMAALWLHAGRVILFGLALLMTAGLGCRWLERRRRERA